MKDFTEEQNAEFQNVRATRQFLDYIGSMAKAESVFGNNPLINSLAADIAKKSRIANIWFAALKEQPLNVVETPPKDAERAFHYYDDLIRLFETDQIPLTDNSAKGLEKIYYAAIKEFNNRIDDPALRLAA